MDLISSTHPLQSCFKTGRKQSTLVLLCDDTEDLPSQKQISKDGQNYYQWHTLAIPVWAYNDIKNEWQKIKRAYKIPNSYLHCCEHGRILLDEESDIRNDINALIESYPINHYVSSTSRNKFEKFKKAFRWDEDYQSILEHWDLNEPKEQALFSHIYTLDKKLPDDYYQPEAHMFCDRTGRSDTKFKKGKPGRSAWGFRPHNYLNCIHPNISSKINDLPNDDIGACLDLVDYCAWVHRRILWRTCARDFEKGGLDCTLDEWDRRKSLLSKAEQEFCCHFENMVDQGKFKYIFEDDLD